MKKDNGVTLIELIVAIAIIGVLAVALGFSFRGWVGAYKVESQTKEMYTDLMNARARAMQKNRDHFVDFPNTTSYSTYEDDSDGTNKVPDGDGTLQTGTGNGADTQLGGFPKTLEYSVTIGTVVGVPPITFTAANRGLLSPERSICMFTDFDGDKKSDYDPDYDCIVISDTRINIGKLRKQDTDGGICASVSSGGDCASK